MIYPDEHFYVVSGFQPTGRDDLSGFGFAVGLDPNFAKKAFEKEILEDVYKRFDEIGRSIIAASGFREKYIHQPYAFVENEKGNLTNLLRWCIVPGDACDLGIDGSELDRMSRDGFDNLIEYKQMIEYQPHNVDNTRQAYALLSLWLFWADSAFALLKTSN
ncbi:MAG: hypothetical protein WC584_03820 [Candidatus Pacearchaeota archaeon]